MPILPFSEYRPDLADYEGQISRTIVNVVPQGDGYGPFNALGAFTGALAGACRGIFFARKNDGTIQVFAGTATKLYRLDNTNQTWVDASKGSSTYTTLTTSANWEFVQFNNFVFATQVNALLQVFDLTSSTLFDDLAGSPPQAAYITVVNRFLVLSGLASPNVYRIQWSGLNATTTWTSGVSQSDFQDLADGGIVRGISGGEVGYIFQDRSIRRMSYQPGSPYIFQIDRISLDDGLYAPYSLIQSTDRIFFLSPQGFKTLIPGGYPTPIGKERIDKTFFADVDTANLQLVIGCGDPTHTRVYWAYKSLSGGSALFDKVLCYDWALDRWSTFLTTGEYLAPMSQPGLSLEQVDVAYGQALSASVAINSITSANPAVFQVSSLVTPTAGKGILLGGTLPSGLTSNTPYYVMSTNLTASTFTVSLTGGVGQFQGTAASTTSSVGSVATFLPTSIDSLTIPTMDNISLGSLVQLGGVDSNHKLGFFSGQTLEATLITSEHGGDGNRIFVSGFRPVTDAASCFGSLVTREREQDAIVATPEASLNAQGFIPQRKSARYARGKVRIPAGTAWTFASGVEPKVKPEGER